MCLSGLCVCSFPTIIHPADNYKITKALRKHSISPLLKIVVPSDLKKKKVQVMLIQSLTQFIPQIISKGKSYIIFSNILSLRQLSSFLSYQTYSKYSIKMLFSILAKAQHTRCHIPRKKKKAGIHHVGHRQTRVQKTSLVTQSPQSQWGYEKIWMIKIRNTNLENFWHAVFPSPLRKEG